MAGIGVSEALIDEWLDSCAAKNTTVAVHLTPPGSDGTSGPSAVTDRVAVTLTNSGGGIMVIASAASSLLASASELWAYLSVWEGFDGDPGEKFLFSAKLQAAKAVAATDVVNIAGLTFQVPIGATD